MWAVSIGPLTDFTLRGMLIIGPRVFTTQIEARGTITT